MLRTSRAGGWTGANPPPLTLRRHVRPDLLLRKRLANLFHPMQFADLIAEIWLTDAVEKPAVLMNILLKGNALSRRIQEGKIEF